MMKTSMKKTKNKGGFTLIELLIVIGLLGALTALILPRLAANREEAIGDVCDYNQAGTLRVLSQYKDMFGLYPKGLHNGLIGTGATATAIDGLPDFQAGNMITNIATTRHALTTNQAASLVAAGITTVAYSNGYNLASVAAGVNVARCTTSWVTDEEIGYTFDGIGIAAWEAGTATPSWDSGSGFGPGVVVVLWVTPTTDWSGKGDGGNNDWTKGEVELGITLAGQCPVPVASATGGDPDFAYYMAYFKVYDSGAAARLIGTSCPECGVLNP